MIMISCSSIPIQVQWRLAFQIKRAFYPITISLTETSSRTMSRLFKEPQGLRLLYYEAAVAVAVVSDAVGAAPCSLITCVSAITSSMEASLSFSFSFL